MTTAKIVVAAIISVIIGNVFNDTRFTQGFV